jgi:carbamoyl-phosphate synthase large subunit
MNVLLTCSGRRNYLVQFFKDAVVDKQGKVYAMNSTENATSMAVADKAIVSPPVYSDSYIDFLLSTCKRYDIKLVVPLFDLELQILAENRNYFEQEGINVIVSDLNVIDICNDKLKTNQFSESLNLKPLFTTSDIDEVREKIQNKTIQYPLYVKPRWGMGSIGIYIAENDAELLVLQKIVKRVIKQSYLNHYKDLDFQNSVIFQEFASGYEYGLDIINDFNGSYVTSFVKRKISMRFGETDISITENVRELQQIAEKIGENLNHIGILDADIFWDGENVQLIDMNARFGGGYPFSHLAGANIPRSYIHWANNQHHFDKDLQIKYGVKGLKGIHMMLMK